MSAVVRFNPFSASPASFETAFDDLVRRTFGDTAPAVWTPATDITRNGENVTITMELPGIDSGDVELEVRDNSLTVRGRRETTTEDESHGVIRREIRRGEFSRSFRLPAHVSADSVTASYDNGMLTINIDGAHPEPVSRIVPIANMKAVEATPEEEKPAAAEETPE